MLQVCYSTHMRSKSEISCSTLPDQAAPGSRRLRALPGQTYRFQPIQGGWLPLVCKCELHSYSLHVVRASQPVQLHSCLERWELVCSLPQDKCRLGFINERPDVRKLQCPNCQHFMCFQCKKPVWLVVQYYVCCKTNAYFYVRNQYRLIAVGMNETMKFK